MTTMKIMAAIAASSLLAVLSLSPVYAEDVPAMEKEQMDGSAKPDVDPGASKGPDAPIPMQEKEQMDGSAQPDVDPGASKGADQPIPTQEQEQME